MSFVFTPTLLDLGDAWVGNTFTQSFSAIYTRLDGTSIDAAISISCTFDNFLNSSGTSEDLVWDIPIEIFDQYYVTFVDAGKSDLNQTPTTIKGFNNVPSYKEVYSISPDPRDSIEVPIDVTATSSEISGSVVTETKTYTLFVFHDYSYLNDWITDYFSNRYI